MFAPESRRTTPPLSWNVLASRKACTNSDFAWPRKKRELTWFRGYLPAAKHELCQLLRKLSTLSGSAHDKLHEPKPRLWGLNFALGGRMQRTNGLFKKLGLLPALGLALVAFLIFLPLVTSSVSAQVTATIPIAANSCCSVDVNPVSSRVFTSGGASSGQVITMIDGTNNQSL